MGSTGGDDTKKAHLLALPIPHPGHISPMLRFTTELASRGVSVTFFIYEDLLAGLSSKGFLREVEGLDFRFVGLHNPWGPTNNLPGDDSRKLQESFKPEFEKLLHDKSIGIAGPTIIMADMFLTWAQDLSEQLEIPRYMFIPSGANFAKFSQEYVRCFERKAFRIEADGKLSKFDGAVELPDLPPLRYEELNLTARLYPATFLLRSKLMCQAAGVVVNTWYNLEERVIESLTRVCDRGFEESKVNKIYPVGPLFLKPAGLRGVTAAKGLEDSADESLLWLNTQPPSSVLYVAFGTMTYLTAGEMHELALGLEGSNARFLWVLPQRKDTPSVKDLLPQGFEARVGDRGNIVTGWVPQIQILAHPAIEAFLTHSGWSSCMESITLGVPMIAWPQGAEQYLNCRYLVDTLKVANQIRTGPENVLDRKEVERAVRVLTVDPEGKEMKRRVKKLQRKAAEAVAEGGSMPKVIDEFAQDICAPAHRKTV